MPKVYRLKKAADADLEDICHYTANRWSVPQAKKYLKQLERSFIALGKNKKHGKPRGEISEGLLSYHEPKLKHIIFYRKERNGILVIRVLHERMDIPARLKDNSDA